MEKGGLAGRGGTAGGGSGPGEAGKGRARTAHPRLGFLTGGGWEQGGWGSKGRLGVVFSAHICLQSRAVFALVFFTEVAPGFLLFLYFNK